MSDGPGGEPVFPYPMPDVRGARNLIPRRSDPVAWLRRQIEGDKAAAKIISDGGFAPERWDTDPPGQVNPAAEPGSAGVSGAIGQESDYSSGWVRIVPWTREIGEPPEADYQDPGCVVALAERGRRQFDHIARHDPQDVIADCDAKLRLVGELTLLRLAGIAYPGEAGSEGAGVMLGVLASAYRHREGYAEHWGAVQEAAK